MVGRIDKVLAQIKWDMRRGKINVLSIDDILEVAEATLTDEEYERFTTEREYLSIYQSA